MMKNTVLIGIGILCILVSCKQAEPEKQSKEESSTEISFYTADSLKIAGDLYGSDKEAPVIMLFHQGGSNARGEYNSIIPVLLEDGFNVLAIDQRRGGQTYGSYNRTVANISINNYGYCDAYPDLEAALSFIEGSGYTGSKIVWGSSYSGTLVIKLAHENQDKISGVLAFSPASGGPLKDCRPDAYFESLKTPLLLLRPPGEMEIESVKAQFDLANQHGHQTYAAENGVHGSSMLVEERVGNTVEDNWDIVRSFLNKFRN
ncbi:hypothetical protein GWK08_16330 [Leptobacterium flavescens]|uniref:AB hydrolase-1 domain-containing protein n=1 Tax=Leptobacterium flavescens TaxID=472055 RepID=A0A6P0UNY2_9FLAO|nr:alpha/beta fold hydrolase [Leptobacterium flavescens]NER15024.1 hypothetical protein [Leptobacterium flavescens]